MVRTVTLFAKFSLDYPDHPKIRSLSDAAFRAHVEMILYSRRFLTDGRIAKRVAKQWPEPALTELMDNDEGAPSLWKDDHGDYWLHGYADIQETKGDVEARRLVNSENGRRGGLSKGRSATPNAEPTAKRVAKQNGTEPLSKNVPETETETEVKDSTSKAADATPTRPEVEDLCKHLAHRITENGNKKPTITKAWTDPARLLLDRDNRNPDEAHRLIDWCQTDTFWMGNILSMAAFRKQYDKLRMKADQNQGNVNAGTNRPPMSAAMAARHQDVPIQRMLERLKAKRANAAVGMEGEQDAADEIVAELQRLNVESHWWAAA